MVRETGTVLKNKSKRNKEIVFVDWRHTFSKDIPFKNATDRTFTPEFANCKILKKCLVGKIKYSNNNNVFN